MISLPDESLDLPGDPSGGAGWHGRSAGIPARLKEEPGRSGKNHIPAGNIEVSLGNH